MERKEATHLQYRNLELVNLGIVIIIAITLPAIGVLYSRELKYAFYFKKNFVVAVAILAVSYLYNLLAHRLNNKTLVESEQSSDYDGIEYNGRWIWIYTLQYYLGWIMVCIIINDGEELVDFIFELIIHTAILLYIHDITYGNKRVKDHNYPCELIPSQLKTFYRYEINLFLYNRVFPNSRTVFSILIARWLFIPFGYLSMLFPLTIAIGSICTKHHTVTDTVAGLVIGIIMNIIV